MSENQAFSHRRCQTSCWVLSIESLSDDADIRIRLAAMDHCAELRRLWGEAVPASEFTRGFPFEGQTIKLVSWGRGIFKPEQLSDGPLTLVSSLASRYADEHLEGNQVLYDFAPTSFEWANRGLKALGESLRPVILLKQVKEKPGSEYMIFSPVYVVQTLEPARKFRLDLAATAEAYGADEPTITGIIEKRYGTAIAKVRIHQAHFRRDVLSVYRDRCCVCELRERPLLDAAHIISDIDAEGDPTVQNGLSLCALHHRAYDRRLFGVDENYHVQVDRGRLAYADSAPTHQALLQYQGQKIWLPGNAAHHPAPELLKRREEAA